MICLYGGIRSQRSCHFLNARYVFPDFLTQSQGCQAIFLIPSLHITKTVHSVYLTEVFMTSVKIEGIHIIKIRYNTNSQGKSQSLDINESIYAIFIKITKSNKQIIFNHI